MLLDLLALRRQAVLALALTATAALTLAGCAAGPASDTSGDAQQPDSAAETSTGDEGSDGSGDEPTLPNDFPEDLFVPDGQLVSAVGGIDGWEIVRVIDHVDQARVAVDWNVKSYNFTINEHIDDGDNSRWNISNDKYDVVVDVRPGSSLTVTYKVDAR